MQIFHLLKDNAVIFTGTNAEVFEKLLTTQPQSTGWALKHGGYKIEPTTHTTEHADRLRCDECGTVYHSPDEIEYIEGNNGVCSDCENNNDND